MRTVRTTDQLDNLRKPAVPAPAPVAPPPAPVVEVGKEVVEAIAKGNEQIIAAIKSITERKPAASAPVAVTLKETEKIKHWKFTCEYDDKGKLTSIDAKAQ